MHAEEQLLNRETSPFVLQFLQLLQLLIHSRLIAVVRLQVSSTIQTDLAEVEQLADRLILLLLLFPDIALETLPSHGLSPMLAEEQLQNHETSL